MQTQPLASALHALANVVLHGAADVVQQDSAHLSLRWLACAAPREHAKADQVISFASEHLLAAAAGAQIPREGSFAWIAGTSFHCDSICAVQLRPACVLKAAPVQEGAWTHALGTEAAAEAWRGADEGLLLGVAPCLGGQLLQLLNQNQPLLSHAITPSETAQVLYLE